MNTVVNNTCCCCAVKSKELMIFDFDETLIDCNTDTYINSLAPQGKLPKEYSYQAGMNWNNYMQQVFKYLYENDCREEDYRKCLIQAPLVDGMKELLHNLFKGTKTKCFDVIIISDANSFSINTYLNHHNLKDFFQEIITNPAQFDKSGCLRLDYYHHQDWCKLSPVNLCKGHALEEYVNKQKQQNINYDRICYTGDGSNDLCPSLRLSSNDFVFARKDYPLHRLALEKLKTNELKAKVIPFSNGNDIWQIISK